MTYVMSDLHGRYDRYSAMLDKINFSSDDVLYVLGDTIDGDYRANPEPVRLLKDMKSRKNIINLQGNHELWALPFLCPLKEIDFSAYGGVLGYRRYPFEDIFVSFNEWLTFGGFTTLADFASIQQSEVAELVDYIESWSFYEDIAVGEKRYILSHAGLYDPYTTLEELPYISPEEWTFSLDLDYTMWYFRKEKNIFLVTGHNPTENLGSKYRGKIYRNKNHILVDTGTIFGRNTGCICLDTDEEYYV